MSARWHNKSTMAQSDKSDDSASYRLTNLLALCELHKLDHPTSKESRGNGLAIHSIHSYLVESYGSDSVVVRGSHSPGGLPDSLHVIHNDEGYPHIIQHYGQSIARPVHYELLPPCFEPKQQQKEQRRKQNVNNKTLIKQSQRKYPHKKSKRGKSHCNRYKRGSSRRR